jgi:outer membrane lipoprotein carrier protein
MKILINLVSLLLLLTFAAFPQNDASRELKKVQDKYKSLNNLSADFAQMVNNKTTLTGKLFWQKGNKIRIELKNSTIISDGKSIWNYNKPKKQVIINNAGSTNPSYFNIDNFIYDYPEKCDVTLEEKDLLLVPKKESGLDFQRARIHATAENLISSLQVENLAGTRMVIELSNYQLNKNIPDSKFSFSTPEGVKVIDLRK